MAENYQNGAASFQSDTPRPQPDVTFSSEEIEALAQHRKRYLASTYITTGFPVDTMIIGQQPNGGVGTYQTSTKEETTAYSYETTSTTECCQTCQGQGCDVDHGRARWTQIMNQKTNSPEDVEVIEDSGTDVNWISPKLARECGLRIRDAPPSIGFLDFHGKRYVPTGFVDISLTGKLSKTARTEFFLAPDNTPIDGLVIGNGFVKAVGHSHTVFKDEPVGGRALIMVQKKVTETEKVTIQVGRAQADNKSRELEQKRMAQKQQRSSSFHSSRQHKLIGSSSRSQRGRKEE